MGGVNRTRLTPEQEKAFQAWYGKWAKAVGIDPNPDHPLHKYDYRGAYMEGEDPVYNPADSSFHWASRFKDEDHPNRFVGGTDTRAMDRPQGILEYILSLPSAQSDTLPNPLIQTLKGLRSR